MAWFTFTDASRETFVLRLTDPGLASHARALLDGAEFDPRIGGTVVKAPEPYNIGWSYHLDPQSVFFFEMSTEVGDSTMRYIEDHLGEVGGELLPGGVWTGWSSELTGELRARRGGAGADALGGTAGADLLLGRDGNDRLDGGLGGDHLSGGAGRDILSGGAGADRLGGGEGRDRLLGGGGRDLLSGEAGDDRLEGGGGSDRLAGGLGHDTFVLRPGGGADIVLDFADGGGEEDLIDLSAYDLDGLDLLGLDGLDGLVGIGTDGLGGLGGVGTDGLDGFGVEVDGLDLVLRLDGDSLRLAGYLRDHLPTDLGADDFLL